MPAPTRFREPETPDEHLAVLRAASKGEPPPRFETDEYRRRRADALRAAGLTTEADEVEPGAEPTSDDSPAAHLAAIRSTWG